LGDLLQFDRALLHHRGHALGQEFVEERSVGAAEIRERAVVDRDNNRSSDRVSIAICRRWGSCSRGEGLAFVPKV